MEHNPMEHNGCGCGTKAIKGIKCDVCNCVYHENETTCTAGEIAVGPSSANAPGDTLCATFKQKKDI